MQPINKAAQEYYDLREEWGRLTGARKRIPQKMIDRLNELKKILK